MNFWTGENSPEAVNVSTDVSEAVTKLRNEEAFGFDMYSLEGEAQL